MDAVAGSRDRDEARQRLSRLLGVGEHGASAILDMQVWRLTEESRHRISAEAGRLENLLGNDDASSA